VLSIFLVFLEHEGSLLPSEMRLWILHRSQLSVVDEDILPLCVECSRKLSMANLSLPRMLGY
jgi:hypothetical protein